MSELYLGLLASTSSLGGVLGAVLFWKWFDKVNQKKLFTGLILSSSAIALLFYLVLGAISAVVVYFLNGMLSIIITIAAMRLIVDICPSRFEATTFAVVTSVTNFGSGVVAQFVGGQLYDLVGYQPLILINAAASLIPLLFLGKLFSSITTTQ